MTEKDIWKRIEEHSKKTGGHVAIYTLYGSPMPVFPILGKNECDADAIIICKPEFVERMLIALDIKRRELTCDE